MGALRIGFGFEDVRLCRNELRTVVSKDEIAAGVLCFHGNRDGVGSHVGNESEMSGGSVNAFIELLGDTHGRARGESER